MPQLTTFVMVLVALFIWWSAIFHADAQGYDYDQQTYQRNQQFEQMQRQNDYNTQQLRQNYPLTNPYGNQDRNGNYCYNC